MIYLIVSRASLEVRHKYESEFPKDTNEYWDYSAVEPFSTHLPLPEGLDADCVKAQLNGETIELVEDAALVAAKVLANKASRIAALNTQTWATIMAEAKNVYGSDDPILALAAHSTYQDMVTNAASYVGDMFADQAAVLAYAEPLLAASSTFGKWRLGVLYAESLQKAAILAE